MKGNTMHTNTSVLNRFGVSDLNIEYPELEVPVLSGVQRQGDVLVVPCKRKVKGQPLGKDGITVVRAETNSANTHTLHGDGVWEPNARAGEQLTQGWLSVPEGGEAFLIHTEEHGAVGVGPGTYEIRRQREYRGEWQRVAD